MDGCLVCNRLVAYMCLSNVYYGKHPDIRIRAGVTPGLTKRGPPVEYPCNFLSGAWGLILTTTRDFQVRWSHFMEVIRIGKKVPGTCVVEHFTSHGYNSATQIGLGSKMFRFWGKLPGGCSCICLSMQFINFGQQVV